MMEVSPYNGNMLCNGIQYTIFKNNRLLKMDACYSIDGQYSGIILEDNFGFVDVTLFLPSFNEINTIKTEIDDDCIINYNKLDDYLFIGGPYSMGEGCTFQTSMFTNIISRFNQVDSINCSTKIELPWNVQKLTKILSNYPNMSFKKTFIEINADELTPDTFPYVIDFIESRSSLCNNETAVLIRPYYNKNNQNKIDLLRHKVSTPTITIVDITKELMSIDPFYWSTSKWVLNDYSNYVLSKHIIENRV